MAEYDKQFLQIQSRTYPPHFVTMVTNQNVMIIMLIKVDTWYIWTAIKLN